MRPSTPPFLIPAADFLAPRVFPHPSFFLAPLLSVPYSRPMKLPYVLLPGLLVLAHPAPAQIAPEPTEVQDPAAAARELLGQTRALYRSAQNLQAEGKALIIVLDPETGRETSIGATFSMKLARPRYYRVEWTQHPGLGRPQSGAVWNDGDRPRLYLEASGAVSDMESDEMAIAAATGASMATAHTIPTLFFRFGDSPDLIDRIAEPRLEGSQMIGVVDCHIVAGHTANGINYRLWIATNEPYIVQIENSLGGPLSQDAIQEQSPEDEERTLKALGREITEENRRQLQDSLRQARAIIASVRGTSKQTFLTFDLTLPIPSEAFAFDVPEGTESRDVFAPAAPVP